MIKLTHTLAMKLTHTLARMVLAFGEAGYAIEYYRGAAKAQKRTGGANGKAAKAGIKAN